LNTLLKHPLFQTLRELKGNPRACVFTEPMFGIPYNLFYPFFSVYMLALGVTDQWIGAIASLGLASQILTTVISGAIVDKYGRRLTLFITDIVSFSIPCLIWAFAQDVRYFAAAAVINSLYRISHTAWTCLMIEEAEQRHLVHIWTWVTISGICTSFFTPIGGWFVGRYGVIAAMRGIYIFAFIMLTAKAIVLYAYSTETPRGRERMIETRHRSLTSLLGEYRGVLRQILRSPGIVAALSLMIVTNIYATVNGSFWGVLFTTKLGFPESQISLFVMLRSIIMAVCFFTVGPRLTSIRNFRLPLWLGFSACFLSQLLLVLMPARSILPLIASVLMEATGWALASPMIEALLAVALESHERARISAMVYMALILVTSPFGWIAGQLSAADRALPFALNMVLFGIGIVLVRIIDVRRTLQTS